MHRTAAHILAIVILSVLALPSSASGAEPGCRTGAAALVDAIELFNPLYGSPSKFEAYVMNNRAHFGENGDSTRCARALAQALMLESARLYDPGEHQRRQEMNVRLETMGIRPGPQEPTESSEKLALAVLLARLARGLPDAAEGDFTALGTPENELEKMQITAEQLLRIYMEDEWMRMALQQMRPLLLETLRIQRQALLRTAEALAKGR